MSGTMGLGTAVDSSGITYKLQLLHDAGVCYIYTIDENGVEDKDNLAEWDMFNHGGECKQPKDFLLYNWFNDITEENVRLKELLLAALPLLRCADKMCIEVDAYEGTNPKYTNSGGEVLCYKVYEDARRLLNR